MYIYRYFQDDSDYVSVDYDWYDDQKDEVLT